MFQTSRRIILWQVTSHCDVSVQLSFQHIEHVVLKWFMKTYFPTWYSFCTSALPKNYALLFVIFIFWLFRNSLRLYLIVDNYFYPKRSLLVNIFLFVNVPKAPTYSSNYVKCCRQVKEIYRSVYCSINYIIGSIVF